MHARGHRVTVGPGLRLECWLALRGPGRVIIGKNCKIAAMPGCQVGMVTLNTHHPDAVIRIGDNVTLVAVRTGIKFSITIGNNVIIEDASILDTDFHTIDSLRSDANHETPERCRVVLEDGVRVGARAIITKGVTIGQNSLVMPGAVVHRSFPPESVLIGNPATLLP